MILWKKHSTHLTNLISLFLIVNLVACGQMGTSDSDMSSKTKKIVEKIDSKTQEQADKLENNGSSILGSSIVEGPVVNGKKTYFLYGAEHLELDNYYFDIPVVYNSAVKMWIKYFLNKGRGFFERYGARAGRYAPLMGKILEDNGLPRDLIFLAMAESGFQNDAKSWAKAVGPWQFMPYTGKKYGLDISWYIDERRDPIKSTIAAGEYLKKLFNDFQCWELAAAAYNAGEGKMSRAIRKYKTDNFWQISKGKYLKSETRNYVPKIMALAIIGKNLKSFGFEDIDFHEPLDFEEITVAEMSDLFLISKDLNMEVEELGRLNPEVLRWFTPPGREYKLRIPVGLKALWEEKSQDRIYTASEFQIYRIDTKKISLGSVSKKFKIPQNVLVTLNNLPEGSYLKKNDEIILPFRVGQNVRSRMYSDLYEVPRRSVLARKNYRSRLKYAQKNGELIQNPSQYYVVRKGDTLWSVAQKNKISINTLIRSNMHVIKSRMIRAGDKLVVR